MENHEQYNPTSPILILIIDTFHKNQENELERYDLSSGIISTRISDENKQRIKENRQKIFEYLKNNEIKWYGCDAELVLNKNLKFGGDFFGDDRNARYLPAVLRFTGGFYSGFGSHGRRELLKCKHHVLILSALYGLLTPFELIQYYACQFGDKNLAYDVWTKNDVLSRILTDYIQKYNISRIFNFTYCSVVAYHECINWDYVKKIANPDVFHCYHKFAIGDQALPFFNQCVKKHILPASSEDLFTIKPESSVEDICFSLGQKFSESETLRKLIDKGENDQVEFKTSVLWSMNLTQMDIKNSNSIEIKKYERNASKFIIARSIACFLNANGGDLIIGIREDRINNKNDIIGIEDEYRKLREEDRNPDGYRRMIIYSIVKKYLPDIFENISNFVQISFEKISGKTLCWLHIKRGIIPVFVEIGGEELFFIRVDATTLLISGKTLVDYVLNRFSHQKNL